jgi:hypothetical protein
MTEPHPFIVGRDTEVARFAQLLAGQTPYWLLNIYGPGGIGKTIVGEKLRTYAAQQRILLAFVDGNRSDLAPDRLLYTIKEGWAQTESLSNAFRDFEREYEEYLFMQNVLQRGGLSALFDVVGSLKDPAGFSQIVGETKK